MYAEMPCLVQAPAQEWKPDPEVTIINDDLNETSIFDNDKHEPDSGN